VLFGFLVHKKCWVLCFICSMFFAFIRYQKFLQRPTNACMNISLLCSSHYHVLSTYMYNFSLKFVKFNNGYSCGFILKHF
jgi:hypothetical protein